VHDHDKRNGRRRRRRRRRRHFRVETRENQNSGAETCRRTVIETCRTTGLADQDDEDENDDDHDVVADETCRTTSR